MGKKLGIGHSPTKSSPPSSFSNCFFSSIFLPFPVHRETEYQQESGFEERNRRGKVFREKVFSEFAERIRCGFGKSAAHSAHSSRVLTFSTVQCLVLWEIVVMWRGTECTGSNRQVQFVTGILSLGKNSHNQ